MEHIWKGLVLAGAGAIALAALGIRAFEKMEELLFSDPTEPPVHLRSNADLDRLRSEGAREPGSNGNTTKSRSPGS